jgi:hypothetical protein
MKPIAIFYHVYLGGGEHPCNPEIVTGIVTEQLSAIHLSGLSDNTSLFHIGVNGTDEDTFMIAMMEPKASVNKNGPGTAELPTMKVMQDWCKVNPGWHVLYLHTKGAIHNGNPVMDQWRRCMERACVWNWKECINAMENNGTESCGAHWLTPEVHPFIGNTAYWGGNFWWAKSDFINTLPTIDVSLSRYEAEVWIGRGPRRPRVRDFSPHFPMQGC